MRLFRVCAETDAPALERALASGPVELLLEGAPAIPRAELVALVGAAGGPVLARLSGDAATPLAEAALASFAARYPEGAALELAGALLSPLLLRHGYRGALRLLARFGTRIPCAEALGPSAGALEGRSPLALRLARELLAGPVRGRLARERVAFALVMAGNDREEGIRAFHERRPPRFAW